MDAVWAAVEPDHDANHYGAGVLSRDHAYGPGSAGFRQGSHDTEIRESGKLPGAQQEGTGEEFGEAILMIDFLQDLWGFMRERKKFWLAPIIIVMVLLGVLIVVAQGSAVAPFVYTLF